jgi:hypothetical protein
MWYNNIMKKADRLSAVQEILYQHKWIVKCGGDMAGYIRKYGTAEAPVGGCMGGPAIYQADWNYLQRLIEYGVGLQDHIFDDALEADILISQSASKL